MSESGSGLAVLALIGVALWGSHERSRANEAEAKLEAAQSQIDDLKAKSATLASATDDMKQQIDRFSSENWRDVVPDATQAAEDAEGAKDELQTSADDADGGE